MGGSVVGFVFARRVKFLAVNGCSSERTGHTPLICETEPSEL